MLFCRLWHTLWYDVVKPQAQSQAGLQASVVELGPEACAVFRAIKTDPMVLQNCTARVVLELFASPLHTCTYNSTKLVSRYGSLFKKLEAVHEPRGGQFVITLLIQYFLVLFGKWLPLCV